MGEQGRSPSSVGDWGRSALADEAMV